jgi:Tol biopolymer transport system component
MKRSALIVIAIVMTVLAATAVAQVRAEVALRVAIEQETIKGDLKAAIDAYKKIADGYPDNRPVRAQALLRMAEAYQRLGDNESRRIYERIVREFGDQAGPSAIARVRLGHAGEGSGVVSRRVWTGPRVDSYGSVSADGRFISYTDWSTGDLALHDVVAGQDASFAMGSTISPDGRQVAYGWLIASPQVPRRERFAEVRVIDVDGGKPRVVFKDPDVIGAYVHDWTPDGKSLAVVLRRSDSEQIGLLSTDGSLRVLKSVPFAPHEAVSRAFVSPDGRYVAFDLSTSRVDGSRQIHVMAIAAPAEVVTLTNHAIDRVLGWSPDGLRLVFASDRNGVSDIWVVRLANGRPQGEPELIKSNVYPKSLGMTRSGALYYAVATSAEGVYVGSVDFNTGHVISRPVKLTKPYLGVDEYPSWSPDGKWLAYVAGKHVNSQSSRLSTLMIRSMETGATRELNLGLSYLLSAGKNRPIWAPDGSFVILAGADAGGRFGIYRVDVPTGEATAVLVSDDVNLSAYALSRDGRTLYVRKVLPEARAQAIIARDLSSGTERELLRRESFGDVVLSPDGKWLAAIAFNGTSGASLLVMPADGGTEREVLRVSGQETLGAFVAWLPDNRSLLFRKFAKGATRRDPWRISIDGEGLRELNLNGVLGPNPSIHPDGRQFAFASGSPSLEVWTLENFLPVLGAKRSTPRK